MAASPKHEDIEVRAYELYLACGCETGHELQHWLEAETELTGALSAAEQQPAPSAQRAAAGAQASNASRAESAQTTAEQQRTATAGRERR
jgi:hypothetical protein